MRRMLVSTTTPALIADSLPCLPQITLRNAARTALNSDLTVDLTMSSALTVKSVSPSTGTRPGSNGGTTLVVSGSIPVRGLLKLTVTLEIAASAKPKDILTLTTTAKHFNTPTRPKGSKFRVVAK